MSAFGPNPKVEEYWEQADFRGRVWVIWSVAWISVLTSLAIAVGFSAFWYGVGWVIHLLEPFSAAPGIWESLRNGAVTALTIFCWNFFVDRLTND